MLKALPRSRGPLNAADFVRERYAEVFGWCLQITGNDVSDAEDLIHDAYLLFRHSSVSVAEFRNIEGYIYVVLRNLHRSRYERKRRHVPIPILDYDCARVGLATDSSHLLDVAEQLRSICRFACERKEKSRSGSVLILRFFHGYYPAEIASILITSREDVDKYLWAARKEARDFLTKAAKPALGDWTESKSAEPTSGVPTAETLLDELRRSIFASRSSTCPSATQFARIYRREAMSPVPTSVLAHIVSCPECLEQVNRLLNIPSLNDRDPSDTVGKQPDSSLTLHPRKQGRNRSSKISARIAQLERLEGDVYEHRPQSLCIAINGQPLALQRITGSDFEITLKLQQSTGVDFIEVFSEQDIRLLMIPILELPPDGPFEQHAVTRLSDNRELRASFSYTSPWPSIQVSFHTDVPVPVAISPQPGALERWLERARRAPRRSWKPIWRWTGVTLSLLAMFLYLVEFSEFNTAEAKTLLRESAAWEESVRTAGPNVVRQRFRFKERYSRTPNQEIVEVWRGSGRQSRYLRLLDESGRVLKTSDQRPPDDQAKQPDKLWQFEPSAQSFAVFAQPEEPLTARKYGDVSEVQARNVTLILNRENARPVGEVLRLNGQQFEFSETAFDVVPASISPIPPPVPPSERQRPVAAAIAPPAFRREELPTLEQLQLAELQARVALHNVGTDLLEDPQIKQERDRVIIDLIVETHQRRDQIQQALASIALAQPHFSVIEDLTDRAEMSPRTAPGQAPNQSNEPERIRYEPLMHAYLLKQLGSAWAVNKVAESAAQVATELLHRAVAVSQLANRYGTEQLAELSSDARQELLQLVDSHLDQLENTRKTFDARVLDLVRPVAGKQSEQASPPPTGDGTWTDSSNSLLDNVRQIHAICSSLFRDTTRKPEDTLQNLADRLLSLEKRIQLSMQEMRANFITQVNR